LYENDAYPYFIACVPNVKYYAKKILPLFKDSFFSDLPAKLTSRPAGSIASPGITGDGYPAVIIHVSISEAFNKAHTFGISHIRTSPFPH
jgi:hypothetical protein